MTRLPSEYPRPSIEDPIKDVYRTCCNKDVEQSAIYCDVHFHCREKCYHGIVLTSQCDIEKYKPANCVLVAQLAPVGVIFTEWLQQRGYSEEEILGKIPVADQKRKKKAVISDFANEYLRNRTFGYYYLPELPGKFPHSFVCCEITQSVRLEELLPEKKVCVLRSPFREAVPSHFSAYIGRIGTASYPPEMRERVLDEICKLRN